MLVSSPLGGVAADALPRRWVLIVSTIALGVTSLLLGVAAVSGAVQYWMLLVASGIQAGAFAFYLPARIAMIAVVVPAGRTGEAVTLSQTIQEAMRVFAPALAGVLIGVRSFGVGGVFFVGAALMGFAGVVLTPLPRQSARARRGRSPLADIVDAARYVTASGHLSLLTLTTIGVIVLGWPYLTFLPTLAADRYEVGATGYGVMSGTAGLGAVIAGVLAPRFRSVAHRPWRTVPASGLVLAGGLITLGLADSFALALLALLVVGGAGLVFQTTTQSLLLAMSDVEYHGRLQSMVVLGFSGFGLAALPLGAAADATSLDLVLVAMGVGVGAISFAFVASRTRRRRASRQKVPPSGTGPARALRFVATFEDARSRPQAGTAHGVERLE